MLHYRQPEALCVRVVKSEEKGSDVNLAVSMVDDGHNREYECAVMISNDSDLTQAIEIVRYKLKLPVGIINPHKRASGVLVRHATFRKEIRKSVLKASQFPDSFKDKHGMIHKPKGW